MITLINLMGDRGRVNEVNEDDVEEFGEGYDLPCDNPSCDGAYMERFYHMDTGDVFYCCPLCGKEVLETEAMEYLNSIIND